MNPKKMLAVGLLVLVGLYWLIAHYAPFPFSHEYFGLYNHLVHRIIGVICLIAAAAVWFKWQPKN